MSEPPWIVLARSQIGNLHDGPDVPRLAREVGELFPKFAKYAEDATETTPWCGIFVAWCFAKCGIEPVSTADGIGFMWAQRFKHFGDEVTRPEVGDVLVFPHHVTFYVGQDADHYECLGGNQHDGVNVTLFRKSTCEAILRPPAATAKPAEKIQNSTEVATSDWQSGKCSWYSQFDGKYTWRDPGDEPGSAALGVPDDLQGISFYDRSTLGEWFEVEAENGVRSVEQQTDVGPNPRTGRKIDISAAAGERFGYTPRNFPTDSVWRWRRIADPASVASLSKKQQAALYAASRNTAATPTAPAKESPPMTSPAPAPAATPAAHAPDLSSAIDSLSKLTAVLVPIAEKIAADPAVRAGVGSAFKLAVPALGAIFPQLGVFAAAAGFILPLFFPEHVTPDAGQALMAGGGSLVVAKITGAIDAWAASIRGRLKS